MTYRTEADALTDITGEQTLAAAGHAARHNESNAVAKALADGVDAQTAKEGAASGIATLDATGILTEAQRPPSGTGVVIAQTYYRPETQATVATTDTALTDMDATNLAVTFVVPPSGAVLVWLSATGFVASASASLLWGLREGATNVGASGAFVTNNAVSLAPLFYRRRFTGLTPGATLTWKWAHASQAAGSSVSTRYGGLSAAAVMEVQSA